MKDFMCGYCGTLNCKTLKGKNSCQCNNLIRGYNLSCNKIAREFIRRYYTYDDGSYQDFDWVNVGGVCCIGDYYWGLDDMLDSIRYNYTEKELLQYYDYRLEAYTNKETVINMKNYLSINL